MPAEFCGIAEMEWIGSAGARRIDVGGIYPWSMCSKSWSVLFPHYSVLYSTSNSNPSSEFLSYVAAICDQSILSAEIRIRSNFHMSQYIYT